MDTLTAAPGAADDDLLTTWPRVLTAIRIGYARVSTGSQRLDRQLDALNSAPDCRRIFADKKSGKNDARPELKACLAYTTEGDTLVVPSLDQLSRSLKDLITMVADLRARGVGFSTSEGLAAARARGRVSGRPTVVNADILRAARDMLPNPHNSVETIARLLGVSVGTLYNHVPDLKELRGSRIPRPLEEDHQ